MDPTGLLALQRTAGNTAVLRMLQRSGHPYAQPPVQRKNQAAEQHVHGAGCGHQQTTAEQAPAAVQRSAVHDVLAGSGRPMDAPLREEMESRLGADFSDVRIHDSSTARASAADIGARAYTSGNNIVIGDGGGDKHTLAHELTHVIQQRQGPVAGTDNGAGLSISDPTDRYEQEAEANATRVLSRPAASTASHIPGGGTTQLSKPETPSAAPQVQRRVTVGDQAYTDVAALLQAAQADGFNTINFQQEWLLASLAEMIAENANYGFRADRIIDALLWVGLKSITTDLYTMYSNSIDGQPPADNDLAEPGGAREATFRAKLEVLRTEQARFADVGASSPGPADAQRMPFTILGRTYQVSNQGTNHYYVFPPGNAQHTYGGGADALHKNVANRIVNALAHPNGNTQNAPNQPIPSRELDQFVFAFFAESTRWNPEQIFNVLALELDPRPALPNPTQSPTIVGNAADITLPLAAGGTFIPGNTPENLGVLGDRVPERAINMIETLGLRNGLMRLMQRPGLTRQDLVARMGVGLGILLPRE
ncbi:DUF4157 domain-containing protein [Streptomyces gardneri]|uniref:eCIS core domain-containing protein n=1 Tax=Streptomyces gardneri TaxID=66892 RepID=UPI00369B0E2E